jgi:HAD superfamily hydrolase (TIGR01509 family)
MIRGRVQVLPRVRSLLEALNGANYPQAIASSAPQANIDAIIAELKLDSYFQAVISAEAMPSKPDPAVFLTAAKKLGVLAEKCVVIEDAIAGVKAARRGGMKCVAVTTTNRAQDLAAADLVVNRLDRLKVADLLALVG